MSDPILMQRPEWTDEDESKLKEYFQKDGYDTLKKRLQVMICDCNQTLLNTKDLTQIDRIEVLTTFLRLCELARA